MRQRVMIAMALACDPKLIIADEPTTALDVTIQAQILDLLRNLKDQINSSIMLITHDLGVIAEMADYVVVMYAGRVVEKGTAEDIFLHPAHPYTIGLMASKPVVNRDVERLYSIPGSVPNPINMPNYCYFRDRCDRCVKQCDGEYPPMKQISATHFVSCYWDSVAGRYTMANNENILEVSHLKKYYPIKGGMFGRVVGNVKAVDDVSFSIKRGTTMGLVGESGCGKTTVGKTILRLHEITDGSVVFDGTDITKLDSKQMRKFRPRMQLIFQDPYSSLSPRLPVGTIIGEAVKEHHIVPDSEYEDYVSRIMKNCGLQEYHKDRYPHEFSGGQRQRICIARALALNPEFIVCDEPVSALDVSIQAQIINLLGDLQKQYGLTYLFISHDLSVVEHISDTVGVMYLGSIIEYAPKKVIFNKPMHPYTQALFSAIPMPDPTLKMDRIILEGSIPSPANPPKGCKFHTRCRNCMEICKNKAPEMRDMGDGHLVACHLYDNVK